VTFRSRTPSDVGLNRPLKYQENYHSRSSSLHRSPGSIVDRRRSASPASSLSSDRSVSQSPAGRPRSLHRLPTMNQGAAVLINTFSKSSGSGLASRMSEGPRNGRSRHRQHRKGDSHSIPDPPLNPSNREEYAQTSTPPINANHNLRTIAIQMPPPPSLPPPLIVRPHHHDSRSGILYAPEPKVDLSATKPTRTISMRNAGFKPIGKASSALKKFFPGDEDDMDLALDDRPSSVALEMAFQGSPTPTPTPTPTRSPSPQQTSWRNSLVPRQDGPHVLPHRPHEVPVDSVARHSSTSAHSNPRHISTPVVPIANVHASPPNSVTKGGHPTPQPMEESDDIPPLNETRATPTETPEIPTGNSSSSSTELYKIVSQVGEGTFGKVYKARNTLSGKHVALKRIRMESERDGFPVTAMREIKLLQSLRQENIVRLFEMMVSNGKS
jgi:CTD kinase subunit alpha